MSYKLESRQVGETSTTSDMQMISVYWQRARGTEESLDVEEEESERTGLKLNIKKQTKIMAFGPIQFSSVRFSSSVVSDSLWPHELQHTRPPRASPTPGVYSDSRPSSQWSNPAISSSVVPFSSCPQSLPASQSSNESTLCMRWPKYWSFSFCIIPSKEIPGLISFTMELQLKKSQKNFNRNLGDNKSQASCWLFNWVFGVRWEADQG